ncbi:MAG: hypothetical protein IT190_07600 [Microbacteriaceae bacterium]|nr:hypothetical protein [Microbacteriaceae bacterium]
MLDHPQAKEEMRKLFYSRFNSYVTDGLPNNVPPVPPFVFKKRGSLTSYIPEIKWDNVELTKLNDNGVHWMRFSSQNHLKTQASFTGGRVDAVGTHYTTKGLIRVEIYLSKSGYQTEDADNLNLIVERCFVQANSPCGVWFRNAMIVDLDPEENFFRSSVLTEYEYDSVIR